jgi:hypothetical protein
MLHGEKSSPSTYDYAAQVRKRVFFPPTRKAGTAARYGATKPIFVPYSDIESFGLGLQSAFSANGRPISSVGQLAGTFGTLPPFVVTANNLVSSGTTRACSRSSRSARSVAARTCTSCGSRLCQVPSNPAGFRLSETDLGDSGNGSTTSFETADFVYLSGDLTTIVTELIFFSLAGGLRRHRRCSDREVAGRMRGANARQVNYTAPLNA